MKIGHITIGERPLSSSLLFLTLPILSRLITRANSTGTLASYIDASIDLIVGVPLRAMRLLRILRTCSNPTKKIFSRSHWFQMFRVAAIMNSAQMVYLFVAWYRPHLSFVHKPMDKYIAPTDSCYPVSITIKEANPEPTTFRFYYSLFKPFGKIKDWFAPRNMIGVPVSSLPCVVFCAQAVPEVRKFTFIQSAVWSWFCHTLNHSGGCQSLQCA